VRLVVKDGNIVPGFLRRYKRNKTDIFKIKTRIGKGKNKNMVEKDRSTWYY